MRLELRLVRLVWQIKAIKFLGFSFRRVISGGVAAESIKTADEITHGSAVSVSKEVVPNAVQS